MATMTADAVARLEKLREAAWAGGPYCDEPGIIRVLAWDSTPDQPDWYQATVRFSDGTEQELWLNVQVMEHTIMLDSKDFIEPALAVAGTIGPSGLKFKGLLDAIDNLGSKPHEVKRGFLRLIKSDTNNGSTSL